MPFGDIHTPSLALSLLRAELEQVSIPSRVVYANLDFAERIGLERYDRYASDLSGAFLGERVFADCLFPRSAHDLERYVEDVLIPLQRFDLQEIEAFENDCAAAGPFLDACLRAHDWGRYRAIGFSTTFQQNVASLAFARRLKQAHPDVAILFGGANCEGTMGAQLLASFPWIDFVCTGEGDDVVPALALELAGRLPPRPIAGILRRSPEAPLSHPPMVTSLDRLPFPEVSDYFERVNASAGTTAMRCHVTLETSRGCWWGEKHHCTFCGLNGLTMKFRSKSPERARREILELSSRYKPMLDPTRGISFADNILDMGYFRSLLPALREAGLGTTLFYETKANLTRDQVRLLAESGIREIQPGIESLHTGLLKLMRKGCTSLQNIQLLKWCRSFGIKPHWNLLFGFPGEDPRWFDEQARIVPSLSHLTPPGILGPVRLDRFSPYFTEAGAHGITNVRPAAALAHIYPLPAADLQGLAYHFDFDYADGRDPVRYIGPLRDAVREWRRVEHEAFLYALPWDGGLLIWDHRNAAHRLLDPATRQLYEFCDRVRGGQEIRSFAVETLGAAVGEVSERLAEWIEAGLMIGEDDRYLALAVLIEDGAQPLTLDSSVSGVKPSSPALAPGRPLRRPDAPWLALPQGTLVLDRAQGRMIVLSGEAARVWARADGDRDIAPMSPEVERALAALVAEGLIRIR